MVRGGRRGAVSVMYEVLISLILLAFFVVVTYFYIGANATGEAFFSKFYAADLGTSAELVNAPYGDVVLRYDNLKPTLDLTFWFKENGVIAVAKSPIPTERSWLPRNTAPDRKELSTVLPETAAIHIYGKAREYPLPSVLANPQFLALRKEGDAFAITEAAIVLAPCSKVEPSIPLSEARIHLDAEQEIQEGFEDFMMGTKLHTVPLPEQANIKITAKRVEGENQIVLRQTSEEGQAFACIFRQKIEILSARDFTVVEPPLGTMLVLDITVQSDTNKEYIGRAIALALIEVYSGSASVVTPTPAQATTQVSDPVPTPPPQPAVPVSAPVPLAPTSCPVTIARWSGSHPFGVDWSGAKPELRQAYEAFNDAVGREQTVTSVWRPQAYQDHIRSVWDAWRFVRNEDFTVNDASCPNDGQTISPPEGWELCAALKAELEKSGGELDKHAARGDTRPACQSDHITGIAIAIRPPAVTGPVYEDWRNAAENLPGDLKLCHYIAGDEPHFGLAKYLSVTECNVK